MVSMLYITGISFFLALSPDYWCFVETAYSSGYMAINSKGEKGCESPICLWVTRWLLILFGSCGTRPVFHNYQCRTVLTWQMLSGKIKCPWFSWWTCDSPTANTYISDLEFDLVFERLLSFSASKGDNLTCRSMCLVPLPSLCPSTTSSNPTGINAHCPRLKFLRYLSGGLRLGHPNADASRYTLRPYLL